VSEEYVFASDGVKVLNLSSQIWANVLPLTTRSNVSTIMAITRRRIPNGQPAQSNVEIDETIITIRIKEKLKPLKIGLFK
jgi:hypothetical protein